MSMIYLRKRSLTRLADVRANFVEMNRRRRLVGQARANEPQELQETRGDDTEQARQRIQAALKRTGNL